MTPRILLPLLLVVAGGVAQAVAAGVASAEAVAAGAGQPDVAAGAQPEVALRYGWAPGQRWRCTQTIERETRFGELTQKDRGVAVFEYALRAREEEGLLLEARFVSLDASGGAAPSELLAAITFRAVLDAGGEVVSRSHVVGDTTPPEIPGQSPDPVAYQQMARGFAAAWQDQVFWLPRLPDEPLAAGDRFETADERDLGGDEPGVSTRLVSTRTYTLGALDAGEARFTIEGRSRVETATAQSRLASERDVTGEAVFDRALGMWRRHETAAVDRATYEGARGLDALEGETSATTRTVLEMERLDP